MGLDQTSSALRARMDEHCQLLLQSCYSLRQSRSPASLSSDFRDKQRQSYGLVNSGPHIHGRWFRVRQYDHQDLGMCTTRKDVGQRIGRALRELSRVHDL